MATPTRADILIAARRKLLADDAFNDLLGTDVGKDDTGAFTDGWVFRGVDDDSTPDRDVEGQSTSAIVLNIFRSWTQPNRDNTLRFPELYITIYSDSTRSMDTHLPIARDARDRCDRVAQVIIDVFHDAPNIDHHWPNSVYVVASTLWTDLSVSDIDNKPDVVQGELSFALQIG